MRGTSLFLCGLVFLCLSLDAHAAKPTKVEVLFMNHGPMQDTISKVKQVFSEFGNKLSVTWHDFDTPEGEKFMAKKGIRGHIPLVIWIDGSPTVNINVRKVQFVGFPTGAGPAFFQGKWTVDDLKAALDWTTGKK